jgi:hypothetical protein
VELQQRHLQKYFLNARKTKSNIFGVAMDIREMYDSVAPRPLELINNNNNNNELGTFFETSRRIKISALLSILT